MGRRTSVLLLTLAVAGLGLSCSPKSKALPPNVVLITVDTLRADRLGCYGNGTVETPAMDSLAREGVVFRRAVAQVPLTTPSHAAILTGTYPAWNGVRDWTDSGLPAGVPTLAEIYKEHGYSTAAFVSAFVLDSMWGLNRGFDLYEDWFRAEDYKRMQHLGLERRAAATVDRCLDWLRSAPTRPIFLWLHLYDPHTPYDPPEPLKSRYRDRPYDGEVAYTDIELRRFLDFLKANNLYDSSLILLTSDHGESLGEHEEQEHGFFIYNSTVHVPLIIKFPAGYTPPHRDIVQVVNTIDIAPTLVRFCGLPGAAARTFQGQSLLSLVEKPSPGAPRYGFSETLYPRNFLGSHPLFGIQTEGYHFIRAPREELYDLEGDREERRNIVKDKPEVAQAMREMLLDVRSRFRMQQGSGTPGTSLDPETIEKLRSLGYVSLSASKPPLEDDATAPDPKDRIGAYNQIMRAVNLAGSGDYRVANRILRGLEARHPDAYLLSFLQGEYHLAIGELREARARYRRALELNPRFDQAAIGLGHAAYRAEDNAEAAKAYELALHLNPASFLVRLALARVYWRLNRLTEAAKEQLEVLRTHPRFAQAHADYGVTLVRLGRHGDALASLLKGIELGYREAIVFNFLGNAYAALGRTNEAIGAFEQAIRLDSAYPTAYVNLALLYADAGERDKARQYYREACRLSAELCRQIASRFQ